MEATMTGDRNKPWSMHGRAAGQEPFHVEDERYEVFETGTPGKYFASDRIGPNSYIGNLAGVARWIERQRRENR